MVAKTLMTDWRIVLFVEDFEVVFMVSKLGAHAYLSHGV